MLDNISKSIAKKLISKKIKPIKTDLWSEFSDPCLWITESIYIQIGIDYVVIFNNNLHNLSIYESSLDIDDIVFNLKRSIENI